VAISRILKGGEVFRLDVERGFGPFLFYSFTVILPAECYTHVNFKNPENLQEQWMWESIKQGQGVS
jgi:hypothetical protein